MYFAFFAAGFFLSWFFNAEPKKQKETSWEELVESTIYECQTREDCDNCEKLIEVYYNKFKGKINAHFFNCEIDRFSDLLDQVYSVIMSSEDLSELTIDKLLN